MYVEYNDRHVGIARICNFYFVNLSIHSKLFLIFFELLGTEDRFQRFRVPGFCFLLSKIRQNIKCLVYGQKHTSLNCLIYLLKKNSFSVSLDFETFCKIAYFFISVFFILSQASRKIL